MFYSMNANAWWLKRLIIWRLDDRRSNGSRALCIFHARWGEDQTVFDTVLSFYYSESGVKSCHSWSCRVIFYLFLPRIFFWSINTFITSKCKEKYCKAVEFIANLAVSLMKNYLGYIFWNSTIFIVSSIRNLKNKILGDKFWFSLTEKS